MTAAAALITMTADQTGLSVKCPPRRSICATYRKSRCSSGRFPVEGVDILGPGIFESERGIVRTETKPRAHVHALEETMERRLVPQRGVDPPSRPRVQDNQILISAYDE